MILIALFLRTYNLDWDKGYHLHPDEKIIYIYALPVHPAHSIAEFLSPNSPWNPIFFIYGSVPLYLIKAVSTLGKILHISSFHEEQLYMAGRFLSGILDIGTVLMIYFTGKKLANRMLGFLASFLYAFSVLPIQTSHFYTVDIMLTFFVTDILYFLLRFHEKPTIPRGVLVGVFTGLALATKYSATVVFLPIAVVLLKNCFAMRFTRKNFQLNVRLKPFLISILYSFLIVSIVAVTFVITDPYAVLDQARFWQQLALPTKMTHSPFIYPFTLQFVGMIRYWYEIKNIVLWGQGPIVGVASLCGVIMSTYFTFRKRKGVQQSSWLIFLLFFWSYFLTVGGFAVGFIRYMLPLYPLLALFAAYFILRVNKKVRDLFATRNALWHWLIIAVFVISILIWPLSFMHIYTRPNTLIGASEWIQNNIPKGKTILTEIGDIQLPLADKAKYRNIQITPYDPDTAEKQSLLNKQLKAADYIIIASRRYYIPLPKLTNCTALPHDFCFPIMARYYKKLLDGSLGFRKVAEIHNYPTLPFTTIAIPDETADETFTVFDHPTVMIFKKEKGSTIVYNGL